MGPISRAECNRKWVHHPEVRTTLGGAWRCSCIGTYRARRLVIVDGADVPIPAGVGPDVLPCRPTSAMAGYARDSAGRVLDDAIAAAMGVILRDTDAISVRRRARRSRAPRCFRPHCHRRACRGHAKATWHAESPLPLRKNGRHGRRGGREGGRQGEDEGEQPGEEGHTRRDVEMAAGTVGASHGRRIPCVTLRGPTGRQPAPYSRLLAPIAAPRAVRCRRRAS